MYEKTHQYDGIQQEGDRLLVANYVPASVVVDSKMDILYVRGHTSFYLEMAPGKASLNLLKMARDGLEPDLRSALSAAKKSHGLVTKEYVLITTFGITREIWLTILPLIEAHLDQNALEKASSLSERTEQDSCHVRDEYTCPCCS